MQGSRQGVQRALAQKQKQKQNQSITKNLCRAGVFMGSGSDGMSDPKVADTILELVSSRLSSTVTRTRTTTTTTSVNPIHVAYLGTATYDIPIFCTQQTQRLVERGCIVTPIHLANTTTGTATTTTKTTKTTSLEETTLALGRADIILVGGGNTLYAIDRWKDTTCNVVPLLRKAMERGAVLTGGSAGAICWFDGGHSDSMDPDTYKQPMLDQFVETAMVDGGAGAGGGLVVMDESSTVGETVKDWRYIRVDGLGFLPGLICPHHDRVQSNGVLRAHDFDAMLLRHSGEVGIGIDHWAALVVEGDDYRVLSLEGKVGSVMTNPDTGKDEFRVDSGIPGIWIKTVVTVEDESVVTSRVCPPQGKVGDILRVASEIVRDTEAIELCRRANPSSG